MFLDTAPNVFRTRRRKKFSAKVTWRSSTRELYKAKYQHDLDAYRDMPEIVTPHTHALLCGRLGGNEHCHHHLPIDGRW